MKQTANARNYAVCAVDPRIRNAGFEPVFTGNPEISTPHNAVIGGTNRDFHTPLKTLQRRK